MSVPRVVDVAAHIALLPVDASARGFFFQDALERGRRAAPSVDFFARAGVEPKRYLPFLSYSYVDYVRLVDAIARTMHPDVSQGEALRRFSWTTYDLFISTSVGSAIFGMFGRDVESVLMNGARGYSVAISFGKVSARRAGERHVCITFRDCPILIDTVQVGVLEGAVKHCGATPSVEVVSRGLGDADVHVEWA
jgi:uncharacterized protein (TIGR02265 family)